METENEEVLSTEEGTSEFDDVEISETPDTEQETPEAESEVEEESEPIEVDFDNPQNLPPELQRHYKGMQSSYTKKMQALQNAMNGLQSHSTRLELLDKAISGDPEAVARVSQMLGRQQASEPKPTEDIPEVFESTKDLMSYIDNRFGSLVQQAVQNMIGQQVAPIQQHLQHQAKLGEYQAVKSKYPDFDMHVKEMLELKQTYGELPLEALYKLATYQKPVKANKLTTPPSGPRPSAVKTKTNSDKPLSFKEAARLAIKELQGG